MPKRFVISDEITQVIRRAREAGLMVTTDVSFIGNFSRAQKLVESMAHYQGKWVEEVERGVLVRLFRDGVDYSVRAVRPVGLELEEGGRD